jgi:hypothetical protein
MPILLTYLSFASICSMSTLVHHYQHVQAISVWTFPALLYSLATFQELSCVPLIHSDYMPQPLKCSNVCHEIRSCLYVPRFLIISDSAKTYLSYWSIHIRIFNRHMFVKIIFSAVDHVSHPYIRPRFNIVSYVLA